MARRRHDGGDPRGEAPAGMGARAGGRRGEHFFSLVLSGDAEERLDDLHEAGSDDALIRSVDGVWYADFDREARGMEDAGASASGRGKRAW